MVTLSGFVISVLLTLLASNVLGGVGIGVAFALLIVFVIAGVIFDVIGVATTAADEKAFHSMSARRVKGSTQAVWIVKNTDKVTSLCNDVVGDIFGIISGAAGAIIAMQIGRMSAGVDVDMAQLLITGVTAGITIGGKALGKSIALRFSNRIVFMVGRVLYFFHFSMGR